MVFAVRLACVCAILALLRIAQCVEAKFANHKIDQIQFKSFKRIESEGSKQINDKYF